LGAGAIAAWDSDADNNIAPAAISAANELWVHLRDSMNFL